MSSWDSSWGGSMDSYDERQGLTRSTRSLNKKQSTIVNSTDYKYIPRLIKRNLPFDQSYSEISGLKNRMSNGIPLFPRKLMFILRNNWFHLILRWPTMFSLTILLFLWALWLVIFAALYVYIDARQPKVACGLGKSGNPIKLGPALAFSLETCTTVGYSLPNETEGFFTAECVDIQIAIYLQMTWSLIFNAFFTAFLFCRLSRCEQRANQILFSSKAIIEKRGDKWLFHIRAYDMDSQLPVVEAHIRMYCVSWLDYKNNRNAQPHLLHTMRIMDPNDELNASLFTSLPEHATHHIDAYSPLMPGHIKSQFNLMRGHGLALREVDQMAGSIALTPCPVCGETYETAERLKTHIAYNKVLEDADPNLPIKGTHRDPDLITSMLTRKVEVSQDDIIENLKDKEILCVVEGIEPLLSGTFTALHSYKLEDIAFDSRFVPCVSRHRKNIFVDLDKFHEVEPVPVNFLSTSGSGIGGDHDNESFGETF